ncbi:MAG: aromatic amino acid hydroxylase [Bdellovibrionales bacterium]|nr:aromatic amino acid hydroxylase [Bdellovibrionales bacterium]
MSIPKHLKKYVVDQDYQRYTPEDHAVWRYILKHLSRFLARYAHPCYIEGLKKTGITLEEIPRIENIDQKLKEFGWQAVPVSGFIPPAAFMEFQSQGFLPIASDMRSLDHLQYTPAPDIVHEAAGHAPILIDPDFSSYLQQYAQVAKKAIISQEDLKQYSLIRKLSDIKESPDSTPELIKQIEDQLLECNQNITFVSEAAYLSRMNWWTAEYGLIGDIHNPKIFGAGLLSSLGESQNCLSDKVKKIPLTLECINYSYDITEQQPQLFVTPSFENLSSTLEELAQQMAFQRGGITGLEKACKAKTVNTVQLDNGLEISGVIDNFKSSNNEIHFLRCSGPTQLSYNGQELDGHDKNYHSQGYSTPLGLINGLNKPLSLASPSEWESLGITLNNTVKLTFSSGIELTGFVKKLLIKNNKLLIVTLDKAKLIDGEKLLFDPSWGLFDLGVGHQVVSVYGGAADRLAYGDFDDDFVANTVPKRNYTHNELAIHHLYSKIREFRSFKQAPRELKELIDSTITMNALPWLINYELVELIEKFHLSGEYREFIDNQSNNEYISQTSF